MNEQKLPPIVSINDPRAEILSLIAKSCCIPPAQEDLDSAEYAKSLLEELGENAVALAAPQIAVPKRFFVMRLKGGAIKAFFNPIIRNRSNSTSNKTEGCLSIGGASIKVKRPRSLDLEYIDKSGDKRVEQFDGLQARAISHELDHLNGKTIMVYMNEEAERIGRMYKLKENRKKANIAKRRNGNKIAKLSKRRNRN